jgi:hypothetical protein
VRALVVHPAGYLPLLAHQRRGHCCLRYIPARSASGKSIGFGAAVPQPTRSHAYASPTPFLRSAQGLLPARAGSPLAGQDLHLLDDEQSFKETSRRDRNTARATLGKKLGGFGVSAVRARVASAIAHVSVSPPTIPDGRISRVRF